MAAKRPAKKKAEKSTAPVQEAPRQPEPRQGTNVTDVSEIRAAPGPVPAPVQVKQPAPAPAAAAPVQPEPAPAAPAKPAAATRKAEVAGEQAKSFEVVVFSLANEQFAINLFDVKEVVEYSTITKIPNVPAYIRGILDLRGEITTIIDLRNRLSLKEGRGEASENSRIIVLDNTVTRVKTGILVDDVTSVSTFSTSQVDYSSGAMSNEDTAILGIIKKKARVADKETSELIIWLDIRKLIEEIEQN